MKRIFYSFILGIAFFAVQELNAQCYKALDACTSRTAMIKYDGTLWAWGQNDIGQLGDSTTIGKLIPTQVGLDTDWKCISIGYNYSVAIKNNGTLWFWGGTFKSPTQLGTSTDWDTVSTALSHTLGLKKDGSIWAWGTNSYGELGVNPSVILNLEIPTRMGEAYWSRINTHDNLSFGVRQDGTLWAWGRNFWKNLADTTSNRYYNPKQVGIDHDWKDVVCWQTYTLALKKDGSLWGWGSNYSGQLAKGTSGGLFGIPKKINEETGWKSVAASGEGSVAVKNDGSLWFWGTDINRKEYLYPTQIGTDLDWDHVASRGFHYIATKKDGSLYAWGYNHEGGFGNGTKTNSSLPQFSFAVNCTITRLQEFTEEYLQVYPNPSVEGLFRIQNSDEVLKFILSNTLGGQQEIAAEKGLIDLSTYPSGVYFLKIQYKDNSMVTHKLVKG